MATSSPWAETALQT